MVQGSDSNVPGKFAIGVPSLYELWKFSRVTIEVLRQPLEEGSVTITRAAGTHTFPRGSRSLRR